MLKKGDLIITTKKMGFLEEGEICTVVSVGDDNITFSFGENNVHMGVMSCDEYEKYFTEYKEDESHELNEEGFKVKKVSNELLEKFVNRNLVNFLFEDVLKKSNIIMCTILNKVVIVCMELSKPNDDIVIVECVTVQDDINDSQKEEFGFYSCMDKIVRKLIGLEVKE